MGYPIITKQGAMLALRAALSGNLPANYNAERLAHEWSRVNRIARSYHYLQETACNRELTPVELRQETKIESQIRALMPILLSPGYSIEFGGDPRGSTVKLTLTLGNREWCLDERNS